MAKISDEEREALRRAKTQRVLDAPPQELPKEVEQPRITESSASMRKRIEAGEQAQKARVFPQEEIKDFSSDEMRGRVEKSDAAQERLRAKSPDFTQKVGNLQSETINTKGLEAVRAGVQPNITYESPSAENDALRKAPGFVENQKQTALRLEGVKSALENTTPLGTENVKGYTLPESPVKNVIGGSSENLTANDRKRPAYVPPPGMEEKPLSPPPPPKKEVAPEPKKGLGIGSKVAGAAVAVPVFAAAAEGEAPRLFEKETVKEKIDSVFPEGTSLNTGANYLADKLNVLVGTPVAGAKFAYDSAKKAAEALGAEKDSIPSKAAGYLAGGLAGASYLYPPTAPYAWTATAAPAVLGDIAHDIMGDSPKPVKISPPVEEKQATPKEIEREGIQREFPQGEGIFPSGKENNTGRFQDVFPEPTISPNFKNDPEGFLYGKTTDKKISVIGSPGSGNPEYEKLSNDDKIKYNVRKYDEATQATYDLINARRRLEGSPEIGKTRGNGSVLSEAGGGGGVQNKERIAAFTKVADDVRRGRISPRAGKAITAALQSAFGTAENEENNLTARRGQGIQAAIEEMKFNRNETALQNAKDLLEMKAGLKEAAEQNKVVWQDGVPYQRAPDGSLRELPIQEQPRKERTL